ELTQADSGTPEARITYAAFPGESVRLLGGQVVPSFTAVSEPAVLERLAEPARGQVLQADLKALGITDFGSPAGGGMELFFQDKPMHVSRWPNEGFVRITDVVEKDGHQIHGHPGSKVGKFYYDGDRPTQWAAENEPWVHGYWFWDWSDQRQKIKSIDTQQRIIEVEPPYHTYGYRKGQWFYAFNLLAEIDAPGEWYVDRESGLLYFWPPAPIESGQAMVSGLPTIMTITDASCVTVRGMLMEAVRGRAITVSGGALNRIVGCTIRNIGGSAISVSGGTNHGVIGCDIYDTGAGGISLSGGDRKTLAPAMHFAENNHIHHYARWRRMYQTAVHLSGVGNRAAHNLIHNAPHMAIGFGGNDHVIEFNEIHSVCYESNDAGAMYTGRDWTMRGHVIRYNYLHDISGFEGRGCVGVYLDDMFSSADIYGNLFYRVTRAAFIGGGRDCTVENNIFVDCAPALHVDARALGWAHGHADGWIAEAQEKGTLSGIGYTRPPYSERYPKLVTILSGEPKAPEGNLIARNICVGGRWDEVEGKARPYLAFEDNLVDEDPHFVDPNNLDFRLKEDSPAFALGFEPIPIGQIGLYEDDARASWPVTHTVRPKSSPAAPEAAKQAGPPPVYKVGKAAAPPELDGMIAPAEWNGAEPAKALVIEQTINGDTTAPRSLAWLAHDGTDLFVAVDNAVDPAKPLPDTNVWGRDDAVEIALRLPVSGKDGPIVVLRGYPNGHFESSSEASAPDDVVRKAGEAAQFKAHIVSAERWTAEWRIPLAALGIDPAKHPKLAFNVTCRKSAGSAWIMWRGTHGYSWAVDSAGLVEFAP
ncbi:MAG: right-handed parallel beta-helix repeat-containing protein, partial [Candidatus Hydrogenedentes bacterium]|nr:right-handed parallel beta-helix repeat-containing protein [Candidatus Hydrogenedentota bacterium]